jgi:threonine dehydratase
MTLTRADVESAAQLLSGVALRTPVMDSRALSSATGRDVWIKAENLQRAGSFKIRGAYTRIARLSAEEQARGVIAASAGNHAQGVALAAQLLGLTATVVMPEGAALPKIAATRGYGAEVVFAGSTVDEALVAAREIAERTGAVLIHPFDHEDIVAGQGTAGLELLEQLPDVRTVLAPVGGGGLVAGLAVALEGTGVRLVGVQAAGAAAYPGSLAAGHPVPAGRMATMADGIAVARPGDVPFEIIARLGVEIVTVSEEDISRALLLMAERAKLVVEPSGAAGVAALLAGLEVEGPVAAVLSGGNIDPLLLLRVLRHGLVAAGRYLQLRLHVPDRPGSLATLMAEIARSGANVVEVGHQRTGPDLGVDDVEIGVQLETRGPEHSAQVREALRAAGFDPSW